MSEQRSAESGGIITGWLFQIVLVVAVLALIAYEALSIGIAAIALDDNAREVARAARDAYRVEGTLAHAEERAREAALPLGVEVVAVEEGDDELVVTLSRDAPTLLVHRIGPLEDLATATKTTTIVLQP